LASILKEKWLIFIALFVSSSALIFSNVEANSQPVVPVLSNENIVSPSNITYNSNLLTLNSNITTLGGSNIHTLMSYSLDGTGNQTIPITIEYPAGNSFTMALVIGSVDLPPLNEGLHNITVYATCEYPNNGRFPNEPYSITTFYDSTIYFTIDSNSQQEIPEFFSWTPLIITLVAVVAIAVVCRGRLSKNRGGV
jgi:hypothetical protein